MNKSHGRGILAVTSHNVWFAGSGTARRISLGKIIYVVPYSGGVLILAGTGAIPVVIL